MAALPDPRLPAGPIADAWRRTRAELPLISPLRKRQLHVLVVGTGLAGLLLHDGMALRSERT